MRKRKGDEREADLLRTVLDYLRMHRIFHQRMNTGAHTYEATPTRKARFVRYGSPGWPDIVCVIRGRFVGIELKAGANEQTEKQFAFEQELKAAGGFYILARSVEDVEAGIRQMQSLAEIRNTKAVAGVRAFDRIDAPKLLSEGRKRL